MITTYSLTRTFDDDDSPYASTSFTTNDVDHINCAHMIAAGFNTMSRNMLSGWVLAVVDTDAGTVQYDGKVERIWRVGEQAGEDSRVYEQTFKFEPSVDADTILTLFGNGETPTFTAFGKMTPEPEGSYMPKPDTHPKSKYEHVARSVLEDAYAEMQAVKSIVEENGVETIPLSSGVREMQYMIESRDEQIADLKQTLVEETDETDETSSAVAAETVASTTSRKVLEDAYVELHRVKDVLFEAGVETIPADAGVKDLIAVKRVMSQQITRRDTDISELVQALANRAVEVEELRNRDEHERHARQSMEAQHARSNEAARAELVGHVKGAYSKWSRVDPGRTRNDLKSHLRGMIEVLSKYLVAIGEADADERHAVALRVCEIPEGSYLYDEQ